MDDFLTTREVLDILKVDRITVYRMLQDGRIRGQKVGQQWRFPRKEVERLTGGALPASEPDQPAADANSFPTHCVQTIQELFSEVGRVSALVIDHEGAPLTQVSHPCRFCQVMLQSPSGQAACRASWKEFARASSAGSRYFSCHAGIQYVSAPILDNEKTFGYFLAGEFYWHAPNLEEQTDRAQHLAANLNIPGETLAQAAQSIPVIETELHTRVETWPAAAAQAVQTILQERLGFMMRFQQIANLIKI